MLVIVCIHGMESQSERVDSYYLIEERAQCIKRIGGAGGRRRAQAGAGGRGRAQAGAGGRRQA